MFNLSLFPLDRHWRSVLREDPAARALADRHYSRQTHGAPGFLPPGQSLVLLTEDQAAVWGVVRNLDGGGQIHWRCTIFRNEGHVLSSDLVREATTITYAYWARRHGSPAERLTTEVDPSKTRRKRDPGRCFLRAGWQRIGETKKGLLLFGAPLTL